MSTIEEMENRLISKMDKDIAEMKKKSAEVTVDINDLKSAIAFDCPVVPAGSIFWCSACQKEGLSPDTVEHTENCWFGNLLKVLNSRGVKFWNSH